LHRGQEGFQGAQGEEAFDEAAGDLGGEVVEVGLDLED
jgi:hypothetical protein